MNDDEMFGALTGRHVVITGATGSFGRHITNKIVQQGRVASLTAFSRDEERQRLLSTRLLAAGKMDVPLEFVLGDVRDRESVYRVLKGTDVVINAAALKQVPACELNAMEAVRTNVVGMQNILDAARDNGVAQVLTISTDKAVQPINTMGVSKAMQERLVQSHALRYDDNRVTVVRYGNVLGSTGSILPVFIDQVRKTGRITVTHPAMTRFLLTLDDALGLVSSALEGIEPTGTLYVRHASAVSVADFAEVVSDMMSESVEIDVVGARPGDKHHEVLVSEDEMRRSTRVSENFVIAPIAPAEQPGAGSSGTPETDPVAFSSDVAPRIPFEVFRGLVQQWCEANGVGV